VIPATVRIFACTEPVDMRRGFDGLSRAVQELLDDDPRSGALFVFTNKRRNRLKVLWFDKNGYCILYKRLHRALFELPSPASRSQVGIRINGEELARILEGVTSKRRRTWYVA